MLGIPTRSDVKDEIYHKSIEFESARTGLEGLLNSAVCKIHMHNKVNNAFRMAGVSNLTDIEAVYENGILTNNQARGFLDSNKIIGNYFNIIDSIKQILVKNKDLFSQPVNHTNFIITHSKGETRSGIESVDCPNLLQKILQSISEYEKDLSFQTSHMYAPEKQIHETYKILIKYEEQIKQIAETVSSIKNPDGEPTLWEYRYLENSEAHQKEQTHKNSAKKSDIYLTFDERILSFNKPTCGGVSTHDIFNQNYQGLCARYKLRTEISRVLKEKGSIRINSFKINSSTKDGNTVYSTYQDIPHELVNLIGQPVKKKNRIRDIIIEISGRGVFKFPYAVNNKTYEPDKWIQEEVGSIKKFKAGDTEIANFFYQRYGFQEFIPNEWAVFLSQAINLENDFDKYEAGMGGFLVYLKGSNKNRIEAMKKRKNPGIGWKLVSKGNLVLE